MQLLLHSPLLLIALLARRGWHRREQVVSCRAPRVLSLPGAATPGERSRATLVSFVLAVALTCDARGAQARLMSASTRTPHVRSHLQPMRIGITPCCPAASASSAARRSLVFWRGMAWWAAGGVGGLHRQGCHARVRGGWWEKEGGQCCAWAVCEGSRLRHARAPTHLGVLSEHSPQRILHGGVVWQVLGAQPEPRLARLDVRAVVDDVILVLALCTA